MKSSFSQHRLPRLISLFVGSLLWILLPVNSATNLLAADKTEPELPTSDQWLVDRAFHQQLQKPLHAKWSGATLRHVVRRIGSSQRICIVLDRRVDPDQPVDFDASGKSLEKSLQQLARQLNLGSCKVGPCIYLGPFSTTSRLATLSEIKRQEMISAAKILNQPLATSRGWQWQRLSNPQDLIEQQVRAVGLSLAPATRVPHDLWADQTLPPLDFAQRMSLVLAGFNLTFQLNVTTGQIHFIPMPQQVSLRRIYQERLSAVNLAKIKARFPELKIKQTAGKLEVHGSQEDHELLARLLRGETIRKTIVKPSQKRYTLRVMKAPAAAIIDSLAQQEKLTVRFDPKISAQLKTLIDLDLKEATLDELLSKTLKPLGLSYQLEDQQLTIRKK